MKSFKKNSLWLCLFGICMIVSLLAACLSAILFSWIIKNPEVTALTLFAVWIICFGWNMRQNIYVDITKTEEIPLDQEEKIIPFINNRARA